jgi:hypothetical protein
MYAKGMRNLVLCLVTVLGVYFPLHATQPESPRGADHWAFRALAQIDLPAVHDGSRVQTAVDRFIQAALEAKKLTVAPDADRHTLIRRVSFDLTGLPPTPEEIDEYLADQSPDAYERMVERYLASPHYGERWGKYWLDAAGYADSNGYFNADSDRPLAYRYRDYVIRSFNNDKPFDQFVREQLAGDELSGFVSGQDATPQIIELLEATHYLRNGPDGTGESDGNPEEVSVDRYSALEATEQIVGSSLLGLTLQCAKCHDHKFEPVSQRDYYQLQSVFYPAFNLQNWVKPNDRMVYANLPGEMDKWEIHSRQMDSEIAELRKQFADWVRSDRVPGTVRLFEDFDADRPLSEAWSNTAPGDDTPGGEVPVNVDSAQVPGALRTNGVLQILEGGTKGSSWLSTKQAFDWTPDHVDDWIQVTFDLVDNKVAPDGTPAARIGYYIALHDFNHNSPVAQGDILVDGNPAGGAAVHINYPGPDSKSPGVIGTSGYVPGHNFGVRVTNVGDGKFRLEQLVDWVPEEKPLTLTAADLPDGGFGFEFCCGRSFIVDNVLIECQSVANDDSLAAKAKEFVDQYKVKRQELESAVKARNAQRGEKPGKIAWLTDVSQVPPDVFLLQRGNVTMPGLKVEPAPLAVLDDPAAPFEVKPPPSGTKSTGSRLAWATWLTRPNSRAAALLARVQVNRIWQHHFGVGIVATSSNLGVSGAAPSHPELLDWLAAEFVRSGWSVKSMHRLLLRSSVYRQSNGFQEVAFKADPDNRLLWRYRLQRLDAESLRDGMLAASGELDLQLGGPYVPTKRNGEGEVAVDESAAGAMRRSLYLQQRRTQVHSLLGVFDTPSIVFNCTERTPSTIPLQSLSLLNSEFVVRRARKFAERLANDADCDIGSRVSHAFVIVSGRNPEERELIAAVRFIQTQTDRYAGSPEASERVWTEFCQMLMASNAFLYVE